jgi:hypothetical protein
MLPDDVECERIDLDDADVWRIDPATAGAVR